MERYQEPPFTHADNEEFLHMLKERMIKSGMEAPKVEVRFEKLTVETDMRIGRRALPTLFNTCVNAFQEVWSCLHLGNTKKKHVKLLKEVNGIIRPSRMTLILGPPRSGKSTILKALSGKLDSNMKLKGRVLHNGQVLDPNIANRSSSYVSQHDIHHAEMTVREILDFSGSMLETNMIIESLGETVGRKRAAVNEIDLETDIFVKATTCDKGTNLTTSYIIKLLGLFDCADTIVGDEMRRGISGGQKKRLTIGEMLVGLSRSYFMDDISTGLDSSTTFEIVNFLKQIAHTLDITMVISLLQPLPETFELFDDIVLLCEGRIFYQGPRENVLEFFELLGFRCPERKNVADFLQEVTSEMDQAQYWDDSKGVYQYLSVEKIEQQFHAFHLGQLLKTELLNLENTSKTKFSIQTNASHNLSKWKTFKTCFSRELLLFKRNSPVHIFKSIQIMILGVVIMTLFLRTQMDHKTIMDANKYLGALFLGVVIVKFNGTTEIGMTVRRLPIFFKQRELLNLPGWALLSSIFILSLPISLIETGLWTSLTYFVIGYAPSATRFFLHFLSLFTMHQMSMSLFRFLAILGRTQVIANVFCSIILSATFILGGFVISRDNIQPWMLWGYWASPITYGQNAVALNEFLDDRWNMRFEDNQLGVDTVGKAILKLRGMPTEWHWFWISIGTLVGLSIFFNIFSIIALDFLNPPYMHQAAITATKMAVKTNKEDKLQSNETSASHDTILPFQPLSLAFSHISYYVDMPTEMKKSGMSGQKLQLLHNVSGAFRPGVLSALMGITGAGKTTLLDVLSGRKTGGYIDGTISISGYPKSQETFARISGYCEQTDIHSPYVTVFESLQYSAWLRLPASIEVHKRNIFIKEVMDLVELTNLKHIMVGLPGKGLSDEQRKRLTIAVELVSSPSILFMDEPTSGLDARAAAIVMRAVRRTVDTGRTVVCTIHQPSIEIFESFDDLLLMKRGGELIFSGPLGRLSQNMIHYFEAIPRVPKIKNGQNPAAWMLDITSLFMEYAICVDYADIYRNSSLHRDNLQLVDELSIPQPNSKDLQFPTMYWQKFWGQYKACLWKQNKSYWKNSELNVVRFVTTIGMSILYGVVFWRTGSKIIRAQDVFNIQGMMYASVLFLGFINTSMIQPIVGMERTVLYRERSAGMYSSMAYTIAQVSIEIPYMIVQVVIFSFTVYWMSGLQVSIVKFLWFFLFMLLSFTYFSLYGMMTAALTPAPEIAALLAFLIFLLWNVFSGLVIPRELIPIWWRWYYWANPAAWTIYGLMYSQLGDVVQPIHVPGIPDLQVKDFLRYYLGLEDTYFALIVTLHAAVIVLFVTIFGLSIKYLNFQRR